MMYQEAVDAVLSCACLVFLVYGIIVLRKWHRVAEQTEDAMKELQEELKEADGNG